MLIRKAVETDALRIADILFLAMEKILYDFMGKTSSTEALTVMQDLVSVPGNQYSYSNCWVAEGDNGVVGAVAIYDGAQLSELRGPVAEYIRARFGTDFNPADETGAGEYYVDSLGVLPDQQGKGIGGRLLEFLINEYVTVRGETLGLLVDRENPGAKKLYLKLGFKPVGEKALAGKVMDHLRINPSGGEPGALS